MILRSLELKHFGKYAERTVEFRRGMNLVIGPNEAGKSTLVEAVPAVLFGLRNKERYRPWGRQGNSEAALVLEGRQGTVRIERDLSSDRVSLQERDDLYHDLYSFDGKASPLGRSSERTEYLEQLTRLFGVAEEEVFRASLYFGQGSLEVSGQGGLAAKIKALLSGFVEVDYDRVLESLAEDHFAITRENPWGKDKTKDRELEEVRGRLAELEGHWKEAQQGLRDLEGLRLELAGLDASLENDRAEFAQGEKYLAWIRRQWQLLEKKESLNRDFTRVNRESEKVTDLEARRQQLQQQLAKTGLPHPMPADLPQLLTEAEKVRKEMVRLSGEAAPLREQLLACGPPPWKLSALLTGLLAGAGGSLGWWRAEWIKPLALGAGVGAAGVWGLYLWRAVQRRAERSRLSGQLQVFEQQREAAQARLAGLDERFEGLGLSPSAVEIVKMQKNLERHLQLCKEMSDAQSALKVLEKSEELRRDRDSLTREMAVIDERMEKERALLQGRHLTPEELPEAEEKLQALGTSIREREQRLLALSRKEAELQGALGDLQQIEDEGERLREREKQLVRRRSALVLAYDVLSGAVKDFRNTYLERFSREIGEYLAVVTCGNYTEVHLDEDFNLSLKGRNGQWQPVEHFSRGTADGVYLAVRLALTRQLSSGRQLPLLMDDPLVNFDSGRQSEALKALENLSREHQVIFLSHDESLLRRAAQKRWNVISLDEANSLSNPRNEERRDDAGEGQLYLL
ncbi:nuclease SbcCD subunit C [Desulfuromonas versatilis]|uniref:Nuclease SbcCD subunit C n=1 Tax=Desulfuromonas versatilis TaxID=2802975 RepID=A0ABN6DXV0_9BACT|nr:AAA family ATPase [Desulfuromonas versatilis]BCR04739.1 nuclease SbcCD subunit C [Desulfuromonas versatilis]